jgi:hypothetical protein
MKSDTISATNPGATKFSSLYEDNFFQNLPQTGEDNFFQNLPQTGFERSYLPRAPRRRRGFNMVEKPE